ncbi:MAG: hypothetical protein WBE76_29920 [Terracidiphilus sp.]
MHFHEADSDVQHGDPPNAENSARQQESLTRLQYMIAFLIEKNEQMRQQLSAKSREDRS